MRKQYAVDSVKQRLDPILPENPTDAEVTWALTELGEKGNAGHFAKIRSTDLGPGSIIGLVVGVLALVWIVLNRPFVGIFWGLVMVIGAQAATGGKYDRLAPYLRKAGVVVFSVSAVLAIFVLMQTVFRNF